MSSIAVQQQLRRLVINQAVNARAYSSYHPKAENVSPPATRPFHTAKSLNTPYDDSTIDFAYMPKFEDVETMPTDIMRIPLLPDNYAPARRHDEQEIEPVIRPEISTVSANGTYIDSPSAMSDVTDNDSVDVDPFDLTSKVTNAAVIGASRVTGMPVEKLKEKGAIKELWTGFVDDVFGSNKLAKA